MMKTFNLNTGGLEALIERSEEKGSLLPNTSRYAWPTSDRGRSASSSRSYPSRASNNSYFARNSPHPNRVKHMKGLLDIPICTVTDRGENRPDSRFSVGTPSSDTRRLAGVLRLPVNAQSYRLRDKAIPTMGMVPMLPNWREELKRLTEAMELPSVDKKSEPVVRKQAPASRQGTRQGSRLASRDALRKMEDDFVRNSLSRGGQRLSGEEINAETGRPSSKGMASKERNNTENQANMAPIHEEFVFGLLSQILQTESLQAIQNWLVNAPEREKQIVMDMVRAVSSSDQQVREGIQGLRNPAVQIEAKHDGADAQRPAFDDQLLQHESSIDRDEIEKYNKEWKTVEAEIRKEKPKSILEKLNNNSSDKNKNGESTYADYEWSANATNNKPSTPFKIFEAEKPRPGTAEAQIEEIRSKLASRSSVKVFNHNRQASQQGGRPSTQQGVKKTRSPSNSDKGAEKEQAKTVAPFNES